MVEKISPHTSNVLDLARAVAAGLVVLFHARLYVLGGQFPSSVSGALAYSVTNCGTQAVLWFFVISGYLVGGSVLADIKAARFSFERYFIHRMARLYVVLLPALVLVYVLDSLRIAALGINAHAGFETTTSLAPMNFLGNALFLQTILVPTYGSNYALWSLACEFWYYLLFPLLLAPLMITRSWPSRLWMSTCGGVLFLFLMRENISLAWLFVVWCIGVGVRVLPGRLVKSEALAWLAAIGAVLVYHFAHPVLGPLATLAVGIAFGCAINASHGKVSQWRYARAVKGFGAFSYSLYLVHLPVQHYLLTMARHDADPFLSLPPFAWTTVIIIVGLVVASYASAFAFSLATERHTQWLRDRVSLLIARAHLATANSTRAKK